MKAIDDAPTCIFAMPNRSHFQRIHQTTRIDLGDFLELQEAHRNPPGGSQEAPRGPHIDLASTSHRPNIDKTSISHRTETIELTSTSHRTHIELAESKTYIQMFYREWNSRYLAFGDRMLIMIFVQRYDFRSYVRFSAIGTIFVHRHDVRP